MSSHPVFEKSYANPSAHLFERLAAWMEPRVPAHVTPTAVTLLSIVFALGAAVSLYLASFHPAWFAVAIVGVTAHLVLDYLDGCMARTRAMTSPQGFYLDAYSDTLVSVSTFVALGFSSYATLQIMLFPALLHALHLALSLYWILLKQKWTLPRFGDVELHAALVLLIVITAATGRRPLEVMGVALFPFDIAALILAPVSFVELMVSSYQLFHLLDKPGQRA